MFRQAHGQRQRKQAATQRHEVLQQAVGKKLLHEQGGKQKSDQRQAIVPDCQASQLPALDPDFDLGPGDGQRAGLCRQANLAGAQPEQAAEHPGPAAFTALAALAVCCSGKSHDNGPGQHARHGGRVPDERVPAQFCTDARMLR